MGQQPFSKVSIHNIGEEAHGQRLDNYLFYKLKGVPKSCVYRIIRRGEVRVNKKRVKAHSRLKEGDVLRLPPMTVSHKAPPIIQSKNIEFIKSKIVYETPDYIILNKPEGLAVHGGSGVSAGVIEMMREAYQSADLELAHRLDRDTSGCLLIAKKKSFLRKVHGIFRDNRAKKQYIALLSGAWKGAKQRIIKDRLKKSVLSNGERFVVVDDEGKISQTTFQLLENFDNCCLVAAYPKTGRTHQIRVHALSMGQPIIGDKKYGHKLPAYLAQKLHSNRLFLHAKSLSFSLDSPHFFEVLPDDSWQQTLDSLKQQ